MRQVRNFPLSVLCEVILQGCGLDWPSLKPPLSPVLWRNSSGKPWEYYPEQHSGQHLEREVSFAEDPYLRNLHLHYPQGRSLCCVPFWYEEHEKGDKRQISLPNALGEPLPEPPRELQLHGILYLEGDARDYLLDRFCQESLCLLGEQLAIQLEQRPEPGFSPIHNPKNPLEPSDQLLSPEIEQIFIRKTTDLIYVNQELAQEVEFNQYLTDVAKRFVESTFDAIDEQIHFALEELGALTQAHQAFLFQFSEDNEYFSMTHEWGLALEHRQLNQLQQVSRRKFPWSIMRLLRGQTLCIPDMGELPETASLDRFQWEGLGVRSLLSIPLRSQGKTVGWLGLSRFREPYVWSDFQVRLLQGLGEILTSALRQQKTDLRFRDQADQLCLALKATHLGVWEMSFGGNLDFPSLQWSVQMEKILGFEPQTFDGKFATFWQRVYPQDRELLKNHEEQTLLRGEGAIDYRIVLPQGVRWISRRYRVFYNAEGLPTRLLGIDEDITERKQIQEEHDRFFALSNDLLAIADLFYYFRQVNPAFERVLGYSSAEFLGQSYLEFVHPDDRAATLDISAQLRKGIPIVHFQNRYRCKDGSYRWLEWNTAPLTENGLCYAVARDITEQKVVTAALEAREALFCTMASNLPGVIYRYECYPDGTDAITYANAGSVHIWELPPEALMQNCALAWGQVHPDDVAQKQASILESTTHLTPWNWEWRVINPSGRRIWVRGQASPHRKDDGTVVWDGIVLDISDRKKIEEDLRYQASHDTLTNLPNRFFLLERLDHALTCQQLYPNYYFALLFIDLDRFKIVNDSLGHFVGDRLLVEVAKRLQNRVGHHDTVARLSGDEFVVLLDNIGSFEEAIVMAKAIKKDFHQPILVEDNPIVTTVSIGIALSSLNYQSSLEILRDADNAMYRAKGKGKDRYEIFDPTMHREALRSLQLENHLRGAIERNEFQVYYQPIICLKTYHILGFEALVRWFHPTNGLIIPDEFIPLAEETGIIVPLGEWIFGEVCQQVIRWEPLIREFPQFSVSTNISSRQLQLPDLCDRIDRIIADYDVKTQYLKFELTETMLIENLDQTTIALNHFQRHRMGIIIDDFGTGYSSLAYLHRLPIDTLKIDKSFVQEMQDDREGQFQINEAIVTLAHALGMTVVAEGIETLSQLQILQNMGCEFGQGYLFSRPVTADVATQFIRQRYLYAYS